VLEYQRRLHCDQILFSYHPDAHGVLNELAIASDNGTMSATLSPGAQIGSGHGKSHPDLTVRKAGGKPLTRGTQGAAIGDY
jgi:hypothetical protein